MQGTVTKKTPENAKNAEKTKGDRQTDRPTDRHDGLKSREHATLKYFFTHCSCCTINHKLSK